MSSENSWDNILTAMITKQLRLVGEFNTFKKPPFVHVTEDKSLQMLKTKSSSKTQIFCVHPIDIHVLMIKCTCSTKFMQTLRID